MINWHTQAWEDYLYWQKEDKRILRRINALIKDIQQSPFDGIGKPEPLKHVKRGDQGVCTFPLTKLKDTNRNKTEIDKPPVLPSKKRGLRGVFSPLVRGD